MFSAKALILGEAVTELAKAKGVMVATAESCTGGLIAAACTEHAGASNWFERGFVCYSAAAKTEQLGVANTLLAQYGTVHEEVARAMAMGALTHSHAQIALAVTGWAGPASADPNQAIGTVCFAWAFAGEPLAVFTRSQRFFGERADVIRQGALYGLSHLAHYHQRWLRGERA